MNAFKLGKAESILKIFINDLDNPSRKVWTEDVLLAAIAVTERRLKEVDEFIDMREYPPRISDHEWDTLSGNKSSKKSTKIDMLLKRKQNPLAESPKKVIHLATNDKPPTPKRTMVKPVS